MSDAGMKLEGGCLCGAIRYSIGGKPRFVSQCCCRDCQRATGTGHTTIIGILRSDLSVRGAPATYTSKGDSGGEVTRHFCGICGGRLYTSGTLPGAVVMARPDPWMTRIALHPIASSTTRTRSSGTTSIRSCRASTVFLSDRRRRPDFASARMRKPHPSFDCVALTCGLIGR
jgi:hypothetical protein